MAVVDERLRFYGIAGPARRRCLGDADDHVGQHQHADGDDRGERRGDDPGGCAVVRLHDESDIAFRSDLPANTLRLRDGARTARASRLRCCCTAPASSPRSGTRSRANWRRVTPSMRSTAAAMATVTSRRPTAITSRISPRMSASVIEALDLSRHLRHRPQRRRHRSPARGETFAQALLAPVRDGADRHGSARDPRRWRRVERQGDGRRAGRAAPPGRVRQRRAAASSAIAQRLRLRTGPRPRSGPMCGMALPLCSDGRVRLLCTPEIEVRDTAADLRGDGAGLHRRRTRQSFRVAVRDRLPRRVATAEKSWPIYKKWRHGPSP